MPCRGGASHFFEFVRDGNPRHHASHDKHFLRPLGQIPFLEESHAFAQPHAIPWLQTTLARGGAPQSSTVQLVPHLTFIGHRNVSRGHANAAMTVGIVPGHQVGEDVDVLQGVGHGEIAVHSTLQRAIEPFHHCGFGIPLGGKTTKRGSEPVRIRLNPRHSSFPRSQPKGFTPKPPSGGYYFLRLKCKVTVVCLRPTCAVGKARPNSSLKLTLATSSL